LGSLTNIFGQSLVFDELFGFLAEIYIFTPEFICLKISHDLLGKIVVIKFRLLANV